MILNPVLSFCKHENYRQISLNSATQEILERILLRRSNLNAGFTVHILMIIIPFTSTSTSTLIFFNAITHQEELKEKKV